VEGAVWRGLGVVAGANELEELLEELLDPQEHSRFHAWSSSGQWGRGNQSCPSVANGPTPRTARNSE